MALVAGTLAALAGPDAVASGSTPGAGDVDAPVLSVRRAPSVLATFLADRRLGDELAALTAAGPGASCLAVDVGDRTLFVDDGDTPFIPASTLKLLTAAAVLAHLPTDERLTTTVVASAPPVGGVVQGDLWMVGGGDPVLATAAYTARFRRQPALATPLEVLADRIREAGVVGVTGSVRGDEGRYDQVRHVATWPARYLSAGEVGPLSALTVDDGFAWPPGTAFPDPAAGAAAVLTRLLQERGIVVGAPATSGPAPAGAHRVAAIDSPTIGELVGSMLRESDNGTAELLTKELGRRVRGEGSTAAGVAVVRETLEGRGLPMAGVTVVDGSGLDRGNRLTCVALRALLADVEEGGPIDTGLPVGGRTGTLELRFTGERLAGNVRAKTGSLREVETLAGFADDEGDPLITFTYLANGLATLGQSLAHQEAVVEALVRYPDAPDPALLGPAAHPGAPPTGG